MLRRRSEAQRCSAESSPLSLRFGQPCLLRVRRPSSSRGDGDLISSPILRLHLRSVPPLFSAAAILRSRPSLRLTLELPTDAIYFTVRCLRGESLQSECGPTHHGARWPRDFVSVSTPPCYCLDEQSCVNLSLRSAIEARPRCSTVQRPLLIVLASFRPACSRCQPTSPPCALHSATFATSLSSSRSHSSFVPPLLILLAAQ